MKSKLAGTFWRAPTAVAVLAVGIVLSAAAAYLVARQLEREARQKFESTVSDARGAIETRIQDYADVLGGTRGLLLATESASRDQFRRYVESLDLQRRYPGIQVIHYSRRIAAAQRLAFEATVRGDTSVEPRGYPGFAIKPPGERAEYVVVQYVEPMSGNEAALGLDLGGDPVRLAALERVRDSGQITASGTIALALDPKRHPGFAMRMAVYRKNAPLATVAQRREAFTGVVSASFIVIDLMRGVLSEPFLKQLHVRIHDAGFLGSPKGLQPPAADNLMFDSDRLLAEPPSAQKGPSGAEPGSLNSISAIEVGGRRWNLQFTARQDLGALSDRWLPWIVLLAGGTISLLLFGLTRSIATTGSRSIELANRITADLRKSEAGLAEAQRMTQQLIEVLPNPVFFKDTDGRYLGVNKAWEAYFGTSRDAFVGKTVRDLYPNNPEIADRLHAMDQVLWQNPGAPQVYETAITTPDGQQHDAIYYKATFTRAGGSVAGLIGTIVDITERKRAEEGLRTSEETLRTANEQLQLLIQSSPLAIYTRDTNGLLTSWNPAAEKLYGWKASEVLGKSLPSVPGEARAESDGLRMRLLAGESFIKHEARRQRRDGAPIDIDAFLAPLRDASGDVNGIIAVITDITQRKQAELRQAMEHRVTRLLSEAEAPEEVMPEIIQTICETFGFACGARWNWVESEQAIVCAETWSKASAEITEFLVLGRQFKIASRTLGGLLRRVWDSGEATWITDVVQDASFRRAPLAAKAGLHGAFAFPIRFGNDILGVMEFYSRGSRQPDEVLVQSTRSIGSQIGQFMARRQAEERVLRLAHYDELTGLPNRNMFNQQLTRALAQARRNDKALAIMFIDLDRFKNINDTLGHEAGDRVLKEIAGRLRGCLREVDTVGRLGGDEFVVLIEEVPQSAQVAVVAQKILAAVAKPFLLDAQEFHISASIGISTYPADSKDMQSLLKNADISMYRAKEQGKNNYQFYSAQMNVHTHARLAMESDLRCALQGQEFLLHYQPKVDIRSGRIAGVEALVRWQQPAKGLIPPAQFIPLAEETGLIVPIGEWVLNAACAQNKSWQDQGLLPLRMAVNLSARQFSQENLVQDVARILGETGMAPAALELEITESMVMSNPQDAVRLLGKLKDLGIYLSIDDFGTGYSSLSYLKRFPIDSVKIDGSFVRDLPGDADDAAITEAIIAMAHSLKLKVIAESVETEEQLRFLRKHGCDEMQGYFFSKPVPASELLRLLQGASAAGSKPAFGFGNRRARAERG